MPVLDQERVWQNLTDVAFLLSCVRTPQASLWNQKELDSFCARKKINSANSHKSKGTVQCYSANTTIQKFGVLKKIFFQQGHGSKDINTKKISLKKSNNAEKR